MCCGCWVQVAERLASSQEAAEKAERVRAGDAQAAAKQAEETVKKLALEAQRVDKELKAAVQQAGAPVRARHALG